MTHMITYDYHSDKVPVHWPHTETDTTGTTATDRGVPQQTSFGRHIYILDPHPEDIDIETIAASLSKQCRFVGHTRSFYSVAQHSMLVSDLASRSSVQPHALMAPVVVAPGGDRDYAVQYRRARATGGLYGLLHDAAEAYMGDISRCLKVGLEQRAPGALRAIEDRLWRAIAAAFKLDPVMPNFVKVADNIALATERRDLLDPALEPAIWGSNMPKPHFATIKPWPWKVAEANFLAEFHRLWRMRYEA